MTSDLGKNFAEFFAGIGLMRIGLERAGWRISFANDIEQDKWRMYHRHKFWRESP
jgi:DNA (cytosine-5)-methyltransferase 1